MANSINLCSQAAKASHISPEIPTGRTMPKKISDEERMTDSQLVPASRVFRDARTAKLHSGEKRDAMKKIRSTSAEAAELRRRAEDRLQAAIPKGTASLSAADNQRLVHELHVHQIQLETPSVELWQSRAEVLHRTLRFCPWGLLDRP